jgi:very-short-patch-repair endonuclease
VPGGVRGSVQQLYIRSTTPDGRLAGLAAGHPTTNARVAGFEVDFLYAAQSLILEADGERYHANRLARGHDAARQACLEAAGYRVLRLTWAQVTPPEETLARVRHALAA